MILEEIIQRLGAALDKPSLQAGELATALGVTPQTVRNWRDGDHFPGKNRWEKIESVTEVPLEWIFYGDMKMRAQNQLEEQLLTLYRGMSGQDRDRLLAVASSFYNKKNPGPGLNNPFGKAANDAAPPPPTPIKRAPARQQVKKKSKRG